MRRFISVCSTMMSKRVWRSSFCSCVPCAFNCKMRNGGTSRPGACSNIPFSMSYREDPFTRHAFTRPRGYPGDAGLLDYIYLSEAMCPCDLPTRAREIYEVTTSGRSTDAVRYRRQYIAELIDRVAAKHRNCRVLSLACGHVREAELSTALRNREIQELIAIDNDVESLALVEKQYGSLGIRTVPGSAYMLVAGTLDVGELHLAYASGLYDYLAQPFARRLTLAMFNRLAVGGHLLVANFRPAIRIVGYMESFMNWPLVFRSDTEALDLFSAIPTEQIEQIVISYDPHCNIVLLEAVKK